MNNPAEKLEETGDFLTDRDNSVDSVDHKSRNTRFKLVKINGTESEG